MKRMAVLSPEELQDSDPLAKVEGIVRDGHLSERIDEALYSSCDTSEQ
jgi:hypothetical protein